MIAIAVRNRSKRRHQPPAQGLGQPARKGIQNESNDLREGATYRVRFRVKADVARDTQHDAQIGEPDWHGIGLDVTVPLTTEWQEYNAQFQAQGVAEGNLVNLHLGDRTGTVWITDSTPTEFEQ
ncbi:MAG: carbohydrate binding domain-containing protein [Planctomycetes bacterium]|nr:carbohydrate binding domain-containing protein [Planctomycetota bacterium]